jgi:hypothetical protein
VYESATELEFVDKIGVEVELEFPHALNTWDLPSATRLVISDPARWPEL